MIIIIITITTTTTTTTNAVQVEKWNDQRAAGTFAYKGGW